MKISDKVKYEIEINNIRISELLQMNEELLYKEGIKFPENNFSFSEGKKKIKFPSNYIRTNGEFIKKYKLDEIISDDVIKKNIAYTLQLTDLYNYIINRFNLWGSVRTMFFKNCIISLVSVMEELILQSAQNICNAKCDKPEKCKKSYHFSKHDRNNSFYALKKLNELGVTSYTDDEIEEIKKLIDYRNKVHIRLSDKNEFKEDNFNIKLYNETVKSLNKLNSYLHENSKEFYRLCELKNK